MFQNQMIAIFLYNLSFYHAEIMVFYHLNTYKTIPHIVGAFQDDFPSNYFREIEPLQWFWELLKVGV